MTHTITNPEKSLYLSCDFTQIDQQIHQILDVCASDPDTFYLSYPEVEQHLGNIKLFLYRMMLGDIPNLFDYFPIAKSGKFRHFSHGILVTDTNLVHLNPDKYPRISHLQIRACPHEIESLNTKDPVHMDMEKLIQLRTYADTHYDIQLTFHNPAQTFAVFPNYIGPDSIPEYSSEQPFLSDPPVPGHIYLSRQHAKYLYLGYISYKEMTPMHMYQRISPSIQTTMEHYSSLMDYLKTIGDFSLIVGKHEPIPFISDCGAFYQNVPQLPAFGSDFALLEYRPNTYCIEMLPDCYHMLIADYGYAHAYPALTNGLHNDIPPKLSDVILKKLFPAAPPYKMHYHCKLPHHLRNTCIPADPQLIQNATDELIQTAAAAGFTLVSYVFSPTDTTRQTLYEDV